MLLRPSVAAQIRTAIVAAIGLAILTFGFVGCSRDPQATKAKYIASGDKYAAEGKLPEAILEYRNAVQADGQDGDLRLKLGDAYAKSGQGRLAAGEFIRAADLLSNRVDIQVRAGNILLMSGRFDDAKVRADKALGIEPRNVDAQILLANSLAGLKDLNSAVEELEEAIKLAPDRSSSYTNLGIIEVTRGKREAAEVAFKKAIELDGKSAAAYVALGNFYWAGGRIKDAETALAKGLSAEPENVLVLRTMANFAIAGGRLDEAETYLRKLVDVTKSRDASIALADFYIARNNESAARNVLQPLAASAETANAANIRLAAMDHATGHKDEAYKKLDTIVAADQGNLQALLVKTSMLLADGRKDDALVPAEAAVKAHPESAAAFFALGRVQTARNQSDAAITAFKETLHLNPRASGAQVALARLSLASGKATESAGYAQEAVTASPESPEARLALIRALLAKGDLKQAETELAKLAKAYPDAAAVRIQRGILYGRQRNLPGARAEFDAALKSDPKSVEALGGLVALDLAAKDSASAITRVKDRAAQADAPTEMLMLAARTYARAGDSQSAEQLLKRIIQKDSTYLAAYSALGQLYLSQRRLDAALAEFDTLASRDPKPVAALTLVGIILEAQGKPAEARAKYERVMQLDSSAPVAANNLAWMMAESGTNLDQALQLAQTAQRGLPESAAVLDTLGYVYLKRDLPGLAVPLFKQCVEREPNNPTYHLHLGLAFAKQGDSTNARQSLERTLELKPDASVTQEARVVLTSLK